MHNVTFITGNQDKADYLAKFLGIAVPHRKYDLEEIQSMSLEEIVTHKVKQAYALHGGPVLVEDVAFGYDDLGGLPGPFVKYFVEQTEGFEKMCRMADGLATRRVTASCVFGYFDGETVELFRAQLGGTIAQEPFTGATFGWDAVFCPDGYGGKTRAELSEADNEKTYKLIKPLDEVREFLTSL